MSNNDIIILRRDCEALLVPSGAKVLLTKDTEVSITQELGGTYTVNVYGNLARIDAKNADALGREPTNPLTELDKDATLEDKVWAMMKAVFDPEIPVNVVDLGLIYNCEITPLGKNEFQIDIKMTLTAAGCGMGPVIASDVKHKILSLDEVKDVEVEIVFDPPWDRDMISDAAKLHLGMF